MKPLRPWLLAAAALVSLSAVQAQNGKAADRPNVSVGDTWTYKQTFKLDGEPGTLSTSSVTDAAADRIVTRSGNATIVYTGEWGRVESRRGDKITFAADPASPLYQFPLEVGKRWSSSFKSVSRGGERHFDYERTGVVDAVESVTVEAGSFETYRVRIESSYRCTKGCTHSGRQVQTLWYAPAVKRHVKSEFEDRSDNNYKYRDAHELVSFKPGR